MTEGDGHVIGSGRSRGGGPSASGDEGFVTVANESDVARGDVTVVDAGGRSLCLGHCADGTWGAIDNVCTHDGGILGEGELDGCAVECPRHGARFDLQTGAVLALPAVYPVNAYPVRVVDGRVEVKVDVPTRELEIG